MAEKVDMTDLDTNVAFSYEVFDRQLSNFLQMSEVLVDGWEDYDSQEMSYDIKSLYIKASRLCYMADQDLALQHADVTQERREKNEQFHNQMEELIPLLQRIRLYRLGRGDLPREEGPVWDDEVVAQALPELLPALREDDEGDMGLSVSRHQYEGYYKLIDAQCLPSCAKLRGYMVKNC